jgi:hypothetical protein
MEDNILGDVYEGLVVLDGFNDCILGRVQQAGGDLRVIYSIKCILSKLMERDGMSYEEAYEFYEYNILGLYGQEPFPAFLIDNEE